mmetsp:Transcript_5594/g.17872  ORF Transcript_5594/g.17872 Transcript_5594/m.17872 type:complete len:103 (+) Transcript_5594:46-354(+)
MASAVPGVRVELFLADTDCTVAILRESAREEETYITPQSRNTAIRYMGQKRESCQREPQLASATQEAVPRASEYPGRQDPQATPVRLPPHASYVSHSGPWQP